MRALASIALMGAIVIVTACDDVDVRDISGEYTCDLEPIWTTWCHDGVDRPHIVTNMDVRIEQSLPGSGMHLHAWGANMSGSVTVGGDVHAHADHVDCPSCDTPNEYELELEAFAKYDRLESVELEERRHGEYPTPERGFFGYPFNEKSCRAEYRGTCTRK